MMISSSALNAGHRLAGSSHSLQAAGRHAAAGGGGCGGGGGSGGAGSDSPHHDKQRARQHETIIEDNEISVASTAKSLKR